MLSRTIVSNGYLETVETGAKGLYAAREMRSQPEACWISACRDPALPRDLGNTLAPSRSKCAAAGRPREPPPHARARRAPSHAITMLHFCRPDHRQSFAVFSCRAGIRGGNELGLDRIIDRPVDVARADVGVKNGLIMGELLGAGGGVGQCRPVRPRRGLRRRRSRPAP